jgi:hypothetical protein
MSRTSGTGYGQFHPQTQQQVNSGGGIYSATHTYADAGDYDIFAAWLDLGEQDGGDDANYFHLHRGYAESATAENLVCELIDNHTTSVGRNGDHYRFTASSAGSTDTVTWDFGDGTTGTSTGNQPLDHLYELEGLTVGQPVTVTMTIGSEAPISKTFDLYYIACDFPADEVSITSVPFATGSSLFKNVELWQPPESDISWYVTRQDGSSYAALDTATVAVGLGVNSTVSNYTRAGVNHALTDGDYRVRVKVDTGGIARWMDQPFEVNVTPDVNIVNIDSNDEIGEFKLVMARATTTDGSDVSGDINWEVRDSSNSLVLSKTGVSSVSIGQESSIVKGRRYSFKVSVTSSGQTVTSIANNVLIIEEEQVVGAMTLNTLFLHPVQKSSARALWNGSWVALMDDMSPGKRRGYSGAVGGGIVGADGTAPMNIGTGKFEPGDNRYNSTVASLTTLSEIYKFYDDHIVSLPGRHPEKIPTGGSPSWTGTAPFKISEFYGVVLHAFSVTVTNDTSNTTYDNDGTGKITIIPNQGTGSTTVECNGTIHSGVTNNFPITESGLEGKGGIACKVHATVGSTLVTTSEFTVNMTRGSNAPTIKYGDVTYYGVNKRPMFFYVGSPMANPNEPGRYGSP